MPVTAVELENCKKTFDLPYKNMCLFISYTYWVLRYGWLFYTLISLCVRLRLACFRQYSREKVFLFSFGVQSYIFIKWIQSSFYAWGRVSSLFLMAVSTLTIRAVLRIRIRRIRRYVFGPPGSGSITQRTDPDLLLYHSIIVRKTLSSTVWDFFTTFYVSKLCKCSF
jgi:hypothetical protein